MYLVQYIIYEKRIKNPILFLLSKKENIQKNLTLEKKKDQNQNEN